MPALESLTHSPIGPPPPLGPAPGPFPGNCAGEEKLSALISLISRRACPGPALNAYDFILDRKPAAGFRSDVRLYSLNGSALIEELRMGAAPVSSVRWA